MTTTERLRAQLEREAPRIRGVLEAYPEGRDDWKPHERSMPLGRLAFLVASMPSWFGLVLGQDELDIAPKDGSKFPVPEKATRAALVAALDKGLETARAALAGATEERLDTTWKLLAGGELKSEEPRRIVLEDTLMHLAHHRGQLTVYLRLAGAKVPAVYGPSADVARFA
jgi:uncharacterized damage-inducible protein DinB